MKKRGQLPLKASIELIVAIVVFLLFIHVGKVWGNGEVFQKLRAAEETSLLINAMYTSDGNSYITYPVNVSKFNFKFLPNTVIVSKQNPDPTQGVYHFVKVGNPKFNTELENPQKMILARLAGNIEILEDEEPNLNYVSYEDTDTKSYFAGKTILLGIDKTTIQSNAKLNYAKDMLTLVQDSLSYIVPSQDIYLTEETLDVVGSGNSVTEPKDITLIIKIGEYADQRNILKAYYPTGPEEDKNKKLAALIINKILEKGIAINGANIIPSDAISVLNDNNERLAVLVEIGNINSDKSKAMLDNKVYEISDGIKEAFEEYGR